MIKMKGENTSKQFIFSYTGGGFTLVSTRTLFYKAQRFPEGTSGQILNTKALLT